MMISYVKTFSMGQKGIGNDDKEDKEDANDDDDDVDLIEGEPEHLPGNNCPLSKGGSPEVGGITAKNISQFGCLHFPLVLLTCLTFWLS